MVETVIGKTYTVEEVIEILQKFPKDAPVCDYSFMAIEDIKMKTWVHSNEPFDKPDTNFVVIY